MTKCTEWTTVVIFFLNLSILGAAQAASPELPDKDQLSRQGRALRERMKALSASSSSPCDKEMTRSSDPNPSEIKTRSAAYHKKLSRLPSVPKEVKTILDAIKNRNLAEFRGALGNAGRFGKYWILILNHLVQQHPNFRGLRVALHSVPDSYLENLIPLTLSAAAIQGNELVISLLLDSYPEILTPQRRELIAHGLIKGGHRSFRMVLGEGTIELSQEESRNCLHIVENDWNGISVRTPQDRFQTRTDLISAIVTGNHGKAKEILSSEHPIESWDLAEIAKFAAIREFALYRRMLHPGKGAFLLLTLEQSEHVQDHFFDQLSNHKAVVIVP